MKIAPLPDTTLQKLTIGLPPALRSELDTYAAVYEQTCGQRASVAVLIPQMLDAFLASDAVFRKAPKTLATDRLET